MQKYHGWFYAILNLSQKHVLRSATIKIFVLERMMEEMFLLLFIALFF